MNSITCDGCGTSLEDPIALGFVTKRDYCPECAEKASDFLSKESTLRKALHDAFLIERSELIRKYAMKLPDVS